MRKEQWLQEGLFCPLVRIWIYFHEDGERDQGRKARYRRKEKCGAGKSRAFENLDSLSRFKNVKNSSCLLCLTGRWGEHVVSKGVFEQPGHRSRATTRAIWLQQDNGFNLKQEREPGSMTRKAETEQPGEGPCRVTQWGSNLRRRRW